MEIIFFKQLPKMAFLTFKPVCKKIYISLFFTSTWPKSICYISNCYIRVRYNLIALQGFLFIILSGLAVYMISLIRFRINEFYCIKVTVSLHILKILTNLKQLTTKISFNKKLSFLKNQLRFNPSFIQFLNKQNTLWWSRLILYIASVIFIK